MGQETNFTIATVGSIISIIGSLTIIFTFLCFPRFRNATTRLILWLAFSDLIACTATFLGRWAIQAPDSAACKAQGFVMQWMDICGFFWTMAMAINMILVVVFNLPATRVMSLEKFWIAICFIVPFLIALPTLIVTDPVQGSMIGDAQLWCWIKAGNFVLWRMYIFYIPMWIIFIVDAVAYIVSAFYLFKTARKILTANVKNSALSRFTTVFVKNTSIYLLSYIIIWIFPTASRIYSLSTNQFNDGLLTLQVLMVSLRGFVHFVAYFYSTWFVPMRKKSTGHTGQDPNSHPNPSGGAFSGVIMKGLGMNGPESTGYEQTHSRTELSRADEREYELEMRAGIERMEKFDSHNPSHKGGMHL
ncbi:uncharacterized protein VTP21DRAFT_3154 [Calcarisporiella thermophila]|uniref:uncharacterized protein n=1 Tax=Calcarisporiella thermophila TaxID=911321 RepID=UPI003742ABBE